ncbi:unnamed protein product [Amoebophrya sp. A120]|nr:unnamed protein product [Amoebophrya sp. A120]|eukprot:GSA120T00021806001.1
MVRLNCNKIWLPRSATKSIPPAIWAEAMTASNLENPSPSASDASGRELVAWMIFQLNRATHPQTRESATTTIYEKYDAAFEKLGLTPYDRYKLRQRGETKLLRLASVLEQKAEGTEYEVAKKAETVCRSAGVANTDRLRILHAVDQAQWDCLQLDHQGKLLGLCYNSDESQKNFQKLQGPNLVTTTTAHNLPPTTQIWTPLPFAGLPRKRDDDNYASLCQAYLFLIEVNRYAPIALRELFAGGAVLPTVPITFLQDQASWNRRAAYFLSQLAKLMIQTPILHRLDNSVAISGDLKLLNKELQYVLTNPDQVTTLREGLERLRDCLAQEQRASVASRDLALFDEASMFAGGSKEAFKACEKVINARYSGAGYRWCGILYMLQYVGENYDGLRLLLASTGAKKGTKIANVLEILNRVTPKAIRVTVTTWAPYFEFYQEISCRASEKSNNWSFIQSSVEKLQTPVVKQEANPLALEVDGQDLAQALRCYFFSAASVWAGESATLLPFAAFQQTDPELQHQQQLQANLISLGSHLHKAVERIPERLRPPLVMQQLYSDLHAAKAAGASTVPAAARTYLQRALRTSLRDEKLQEDAFHGAGVKNLSATHREIPIGVQEGKILPGAPRLPLATRHDKLDREGKDDYPRSKFLPRPPCELGDSGDLMNKTYGDLLHERGTDLAANGSEEREELKARFDGLARRNQRADILQDEIQLPQWPRLREEILHGTASPAPFVQAFALAAAANFPQQKFTQQQQQPAPATVFSAPLEEHMAYAKSCGKLLVLAQQSPILLWHKKQRQYYWYLGVRDFYVCVQRQSLTEIPGTSSSVGGGRIGNGVGSLLAAPGGVSSSSSSSNPSKRYGFQIFPAEEAAPPSGEVMFYHKNSRTRIALLGDTWYAARCDRGFVRDNVLFFEQPEVYHTFRTFLEVEHIATSELVTIMAYEFSRGGADSATAPTGSSSSSSSSSSSASTLLGPASSAVPVSQLRPAVPSYSDIAGRLKKKCRQDLEELWRGEKMFVLEENPLETTDRDIFFSEPSLPVQPQQAPATTRERSPRREPGPTINTGSAANGTEPAAGIVAARVKSSHSVLVKPRAERELARVFCTFCDDEIGVVFIGQCSAAPEKCRTRLTQLVAKPPAAPTQASQKADANKNQTEWTTTVGISSDDDRLNWERILRWVPQRTKLHCACRMDIDDGGTAAENLNPFKFERGQDLHANAFSNA